MINCSPTKLHKILQKIQLFTPVSSNFHPFHPHFHPPPRTSIRGAAWATRIFFAGATRTRRRLADWLLAVGCWLLATIRRR